MLPDWGQHMGKAKRPKKPGVVCSKCGKRFDKAAVTQVDKKTVLCPTCLVPPKTRPRSKSRHRTFYVLCVEPGMDARVKRDLMKKARIADLDRYFGRVIIPTHKVTEMRKGQPVTMNRRAFPGYLIVKMEYTPDVAHLIDKIQGAVGLLPLRPSIGSNPTEEDMQDARDWRPTALPTEEAARILLAEKMKKAERKLVLEYKEGSTVRVDDSNSAWNGKEGKVVNITKDERNPLVTVEMVIIGRPVSVNFGYWMLKKV